MTIRAIISRAEAKAQGLKRYFTGIPCGRGHVAERQTSSASCWECRSIVYRNWREANIDRRSAAIKEWRKNNHEHDRERTRDWQRRNFVAMRAIVGARRARRLNAEGRYTQDDINRILKEQDNKCLCGADFAIVKHTVDHIVPLSRGGSNWPSNLQMLCGPCNDSKGTKLMSEWKRS